MLAFLSSLRRDVAKLAFKAAFAIPAALVLLMIEHFGFSWRDESGRLAVIVVVALAAVSGELAWRAIRRRQATVRPAVVATLTGLANYSVAQIPAGPTSVRSGLSRLSILIPSGSQMATAVAATLVVYCATPAAAPAAVARGIDLRATITMPLMASWRRLTLHRKA